MTDYRVFGLKVRSDIALPELFEDKGGEVPDVVIARGAVAPPEEDAPGLHVVDGALVLVIAEVGRYRIEEGRRITVDAHADVPDRNVRLFLLGSAFGALLHQRGLLPLHANAVEIDGKAVAFMGESGAGKSTLAAWFHDHGYRVLADDVCVVRFDEDGQAMACAGLPRLRLWREALEVTGRDPAAYTKSLAGNQEIEKFDVPLSQSAMSNRLLGGLFLLSVGEEFAIESLQGIDAAAAVIEHTYRGAFLAATGTADQHWSACLRLVRTTPVFNLIRTRRLDRLDEEARLVLDRICA
jgi:hypothetical protein